MPSSGQRNPLPGTAAAGAAAVGSAAGAAPAAGGATGAGARTAAEDTETKDGAEPAAAEDGAEAAKVAGSSRISVTAARESGTGSRRARSARLSDVRFCRMSASVAGTVDRDKAVDRGLWTGIRLWTNARRLVDLLWA